MKKNLTKIICMGVMLIMCVGILCACNENETNSNDNFDAIMFDRVIESMKNDFLKSLPSYGGEFGEDTIIVVKDRATYNNIFTGTPISLDFKKEMIVACIYTDINNGFPCKIKDINIEEGTLILSLYSDLPKDDEGRTPPCASSPTQRGLAIKMRKVDYSEIRITWTN